ncbi:RNA methyltransferase [Candidatus Uabimicrobium sp. HlEnr_7]|uniref:RNA methyltransferase n=1 Tax=Candidatus Uabimicrobium helgolandensis TaxID=3095367 RepID=UPI0035588534
MPVDKYTVLDKDMTKEELSAIERVPLYFVLDNVRSAFNVGSAFRTADAGSIKQICICGISAYPPNKKLAKTALGATDSVPWKYYDTTVEAIKNLKSQGVNICIVELTSHSENFWEHSFAKPTALVFGHEVTGVSEETLELADCFVHIPMNGKKSTLNVATSVGVVMFEALRQWRK